jgi:hypothetical protein
VSDAEHHLLGNWYADYTAKQEILNILRKGIPEQPKFRLNYISLGNPQPLSLTSLGLSGHRPATLVLQFGHFPSAVSWYFVIVYPVRRTTI